MIIYIYICIYIYIYILRPSATAAGPLFSESQRLGVSEVRMLRGLEARLVVGSLLTCALKQACNVVWLFVVLFLLCVFCVFLRRLFARKGCSWGGLGHPLVSLSASCWPQCSRVSICFLFLLLFLLLSCSWYL